LPLTILMRFLARGVGGGPATTAPVVILNSPPWQGQPMTPLATLSRMQPTWVHTALNARYLPRTGWVTTTLSAVKILPPPTGISLASASTFPVAAVPVRRPRVLAPLDPVRVDPEPLDPVPPAMPPPDMLPPDMAPPEEAPADGMAVAGAVEPLPGATPASLAAYGTAVVLQPARAPPRPARLAPSSTPRLVGRCSPCVSDLSMPLCPAVIDHLSLVRRPPPGLRPTGDRGPAAGQ
jgi:hypothetical protein